MTTAIRPISRDSLSKQTVYRHLADKERLVIGESGRCPKLGRAFYERGPGPTITALALVSESLAARGTLAVADPRAAAKQFNWLIMSAPLHRAMLLGALEPPGDLDAIVADGVALFLAAYRPH